MGSERIRLPAVIAALSIALSGCGGGGGESGEASGEDAFAMVNGVAYTSSDLDARLERMAPEARREFNNPATLSALIDREISARVLAQAAMDEGVDGSEEFKEALESARIMILADIYQRRVQERAKQISEEELREAYERDKHLYSKDAVIKARHILCATEDQALEALQSVRDGMPFERAVERYSTDNFTKDRSGDLGSLTRTSVIPGLGTSPEFVDELAGIEDGDVGGPIRTQAGYHIVHVVSRSEGDVPAFQEVRGQLKRRLEKERSETGFADLMQRLWDKYDVTIDHDAIKRHIGYPVTPEEFLRHFDETTSSGDKIALCTDMVRQFPGHKYAPYMLFNKGFVHSEELHNYYDAEVAFRELLERYPSSKYADAARWMIRNMRGEHPPLRNAEHVVSLAKRSGD